MRTTINRKSAPSDQISKPLVENGEVKMSKQELIAMIENAGFEAVERDTLYNRVESIGA